MATASSSQPTTPTEVNVCPVEQAIRIIGGKWKMLVLRSLLLNGAQRYNELLATVSGISAKELTRNLGELGDSGLLKHGSAYELTELGRELMPVFSQLLTWGQKLKLRS
jgi:DNA-binding HxlR family transcriptional regulator